MLQRLDSQRLAIVVLGLAILAFQAARLRAAAAACRDLDRMIESAARYHNS